MFDWHQFNTNYFEISRLNPRWDSLEDNCAKFLCLSMTQWTSGIIDSILLPELEFRYLIPHLMELFIHKISISNSLLCRGEITRHVCFSFVPAIRVLSGKNDNSSYNISRHPGETDQILCQIMYLLYCLQNVSWYFRCKREHCEELTPQSGNRYCRLWEFRDAGWVRIFSRRQRL